MTYSSDDWNVSGVHTPVAVLQSDNEARSFGPALIHASDWSRRMRFASTEAIIRAAELAARL